MANSTNHIMVGGSSVLPVPHVKIIPLDTEIEHSDGNGTYTLLRSPIVTAMDLSEEQIEKGVYVEMAHYRRGKSASIYNTGKNQAGYVVPAAQIAGSNPLGNKWTRGGSHVGSADRPNHYKVVTQNEQIPVWQYLKNRHREAVVNYQSITGFSNTNLLVPAQGISNFSTTSGKTFMYDGTYRPYYFKFRYIMWDEDANNWVSGGWSRVIKLAHNVHPFHVDAQASAIEGRQVGIISPSFNINEMKCWFETRLP